jgi:hypothetical protein
MSATTALPPVPGLALRHLRAAGVSLGDGGTIRLDTLDRALANSDLTPAEKLQAKVGLRGRIDTTEILPAVAAIAEQIRCTRFCCAQWSSAGSRRRPTANDCPRRN